MTTDAETRAGLMLAEVESEISARIDELQSLMLLRVGGDEQKRAEAEQHLEAAANAVSDLEDQLRVINDYVREERQTLSRMTMLVKRAELQEQRLSQVEENLPRHLPSQRQPLSEANLNIAQPLSPLRAADGLDTKPPPKTSTALEPRKRTTKDTAAPLAASRSPRIQYLTVTQLRDAPQYIKGRLALEKINDAVDALNQVLDAKYDLLRKSLRELTSDELNLVQAYHELELLDDVQGCTFFSSTDIRTCPQLRPDSTAKSVLNVLRHCKHVREVRGQRGLRLYIVLQGK